MPLKLARLLAVLVALVVPLQGMAAVAAGQCMALGHHQDAGDNGHGMTTATGHDHDAHSHADGGKHAEESGTNAALRPLRRLLRIGIDRAAVRRVDPSPPTVAQYVFSQFPPIGVRARRPLSTTPLPLTAD